MVGNLQPSRALPPEPGQPWGLILLNLALHVSSSADMCNAKTQLMASMGPMSCVINYFRGTGAVHWTRPADCREKASFLYFVGPPDRALLLCLYPEKACPTGTAAPPIAGMTRSMLGRRGRGPAWVHGVSPKLTCVPLPRSWERVYSATGKSLVHHKSANRSSHCMIH